MGTLLLVDTGPAMHPGKQGWQVPTPWHTHKHPAAVLVTAKELSCWRGDDPPHLCDCVPLAGRRAPPVPVLSSSVLFAHRLRS